MKRTIYILFFLQFIIRISYAQCNGSIDLCAKQYNNVAYLTTHNAFNSDEDGLLFPNQTYNIASQLNDGVRGFTKYVAIIEGFIGWFLLSVFIVSLLSQMMSV
jgi:hypothetical protein